MNPNPIRIILTLPLLLMGSLGLQAQVPDSLKGLPDSVRQHMMVDKTPHDELTFTGNRIIERDDEAVDEGHITFGGYIDTYYSFYTDTAGADGFQKFPSISPRSNNFGLNLAQISFKYKSEKMKARVALHFGDIPTSAWSPLHNPVQEANLSFRIHKKLWVDAGYFRTHIGLESIQPRENLTNSLATTTYFEPYYLSGVKLSWFVSPSLTLQVNAFNSFNTFLDNNSAKATGLSAILDPGNGTSFTFNTLMSDEAPDATPESHIRIYNNAYFVHKTEKLTLGAEANLGIQHYSAVPDSAIWSWMASGLLTARLALSEKAGLYGRAECFYDPHGVLSGPIENASHVQTGLNLVGFTAGGDYRIISHSYLRLETRYLQAGADETIFYFNGQSQTWRLEFHATAGVWF